MEGIVIYLSHFVVSCINLFGEGSAIRYRMSWMSSSRRVASYLGVAPLPVDCHMSRRKSGGALEELAFSPNAEEDSHTWFHRPTYICHHLTKDCKYARLANTKTQCEVPPNWDLRDIAISYHLEQSDFHPLTSKVTAPYIWGYAVFINYFLLNICVLSCNTICHCEIIRTSSLTSDPFSRSMNYHVHV